MQKLLLLIFLIFLFLQGKSQIADENFSGKETIEKAVPFLCTSDSNLMQSYALIAGGSKGIGFAVAEALARRHYNLILIARHADALSAAKILLEKKYSVKVITLVHDLSRPESSKEISSYCYDNKIQLKILCNVAGLGGVNDYLALPEDSLRYMIHLNLESVMALTLELIPLLEQNQPSYILNVASMAGLAPIPAKNMYAATKSAVIFFSYGLRYQLKEKHISVSCLCPGPVFTKPEIIEDTKNKLGWFGMRMAVDPAKVGEVAIKKTLKKRMIIVPGGLAKLSSWVIRVLPARWSASMYYRLEKKRRNKKS
jgi:uncharacterized protein